MYAKKIVSTFFLVDFVFKLKFIFLFCFQKPFFVPLVCFLFGQIAKVFKSISSYISLFIFIFNLFSSAKNESVKI